MLALVTGTSGHVGGAIASHLAAAGWEVVGLSRRPAAIAGLSRQIEADLAAPSLVEQVSSVLPRCAAIVHAAAALDRELTAPAIALANCLGMQHMLALARRCRARNFVFISGVPVIGVPRILPITEEHPLAPATAYHASKLFGERLVAIATQAGLTGCSLRLTSPVGPGMAANRILSVFVRQARTGQPISLAGRGTRRQNYVDVRDVAQAVEQCLAGDVGGLFNVAGAQGITNHDLARLCVGTLGSTSPIAFSGQPDAEDGIAWDVSIARAEKRFGYAPKHDIASSIRAVDDDLRRAERRT